MMREPRRRSPESSRRRRRERERRDSREHLVSAVNTTTTAMPTMVPAEPIPTTSSAYQHHHYNPNNAYNTYTESPQIHQHQDPTMQRSRALSSSLSSSSSTSSSLLDISRQYPDKKHFGGILTTFFRAPSEHRRRRRRSATKKRRVLYFGNSSSSSVNSDLAYGHGYIKKSSSRNFSPQATPGYSHLPHPHQAAGAASFKTPSPKRSKTDEEILALGRQLSDLARRQNEEDLRMAGRTKPSQFAAAAAGLREFNRLKKRDNGARGIGSSRPRRDSDESDWESASDDDDDSSDGKNSELAYGNVVSQAIRPTAAAAAGAVAGAAAAASARHWSSNHIPTYSAKSSVVDPHLFGPVNSLRGMINTPCGFEDDRRTAPSYTKPHDVEPHRAPSESLEQAPMRHVYPVPTSDPNRFDVDRSSITSSRQDLPTRSRPAPVPLQQPIPKLPVSSKVYEAEKFEEASQTESRHARKSSDGKGWGEAALAGAAAAAVGAALVSNHKHGKDDERDHRHDDRREGERRHDRNGNRDRDSRYRYEDEDRDRDYRKSKRDSESHNYTDEKDHKRTSRHDGYEDGSRKRREVGADRHPEEVSYKRHGEEISVEYDPDRRSEVSRSSRKDSRKPEPTTDRHVDLVLEKADYRLVEGSESSKTPFIDPFQFQVPDDAFQTPQFNTPARPLTPQVVTIAREPSFGSPPQSATSTARLSRKDSFEIEQRAAEYRRGESDRPPEDFRRGHEYEEEENAARSILDEAKQATIPVSAVAIASAIAIERERSEERRREQYSEDGSRDRSREPRDSVQEEADRYYRETVIARKIARDEVESPEIITIVTPPDLEERRHEKGPYDEPNADVRIDNKIYPHEVHKYRTSGHARDPSCERERPLLNLVYPTPATSRTNTPAPEERKREETTQPRSEIGTDVIIGPRGDIIQAPPAPKSVTWGENETKSYEVDGPGVRSENGTGDSADKPRPRLNKSSRWGIMAAAIAGSSMEPANEPDIVIADIAKEIKHDEPTTRDIAAIDQIQVFVDESNGPPPVPGPKPTSPKHDQMPGGYADDIEFAATLAAGLQDTGFNPNIVFDDPSYRRRDSPPGSNELSGDGVYQAPFVQTVSDLGPINSSTARGVPEAGFVLGEVETPKEEPTAPEAESVETPTKLTKKEKRRLEKLAKRQSAEITESPTVEASESPIDETADANQELSKKERKEQRKEQRKRDEVVVVHGDDSPRETERDSSQGREVGEEVWEESSRSRSKKNRKSRDLQESAGSTFSLPSESFEVVESPKDATPEGERDVSKKPKKKSGYENIDSPARSEVSVDSSGKRSSKSKRRSGTGDDFNGHGDTTPDRSRDPFEDREVSSVVSEPRYDRKRDSRQSKRSSGYYDDDASSVVSAPGSSRKSKEPEKRSSGLFSSIFKSNGNKEDGKRESFLDNAGTLGAGVGLAGAAVAVASSLSRYNAAEASSDKEKATFDDNDKPRKLESFDPEIVPRAIKPAIDPQYGDLLPLPPSEPGTPTQVPEELPNLPESRPDTPPEERGLIRRERGGHSRRRSTQETPTKSPSITAIPISLRLGNRQSPASPGMFKSSPIASPVAATAETASRRPGRPTSWDSSREFKPLYLLEHSRHGPNEPPALEFELPALPPSEPPSSRESPAPEDQMTTLGEEDAGRGIGAFDLMGSGLRIDTNLPSAPRDVDVAGSQETTPKAGIRPELPEVPMSSTPERGNHFEDSFQEPDPVDPMSKDRSSYLLNSAPSSIRSNRSIDVGNLEQSMQDSTPTKARAGDPNLPDIAEDLTSADEHFSDAVEGHSGDDTFQDAADTPTERVVIEPILTQLTATEETPAADTPTERVIIEPILTQPAATEETPTADPVIDETSEEWASLSAKERKKLKKARKKALDAAAVEDTNAAPLATDAVAAEEPDAQHAPEILDATEILKQDAPETPQETMLDDVALLKSSKKNKKKKNKALASEEADPQDSTPIPASEEVTPFETPADTPTLISEGQEIVDNPSDAPLSLDADKAVESNDTTTILPTEPADPFVESKDDQSVALEEAAKEAETEPPTPVATEAEEAPASSKKSKKKKKKGKASTALDEATAEILPSEPTNLTEGNTQVEKPEDQPELGPSDNAVVETTVNLEATEPVAETKPEVVEEPVSETKPEAVEEPVPETKPEAVEEPVSETKPEAAEEPVSETKPEAAEEPVAEAAPPTSDAPTETSPDDLWSTPALSKKDKKKKKKKGGQTEDSVVAEEVEEPALSQDNAPPATTEPLEQPSDDLVGAEQEPESKSAVATDLSDPKEAAEPTEAEAETVPIAKGKKKKKDKRKSVQWEPEAEPPSASIESTAPEEHPEPETTQADPTLSKELPVDSPAGQTPENGTESSTYEASTSRDLEVEDSKDSKHTSGILPAAAAFAAVGSAWKKVWGSSQSATEDPTDAGDAQNDAAKGHADEQQPDVVAENLTTSATDPADASTEPDKSDLATVAQEGEDKSLNPNEASNEQTTAQPVVGSGGADNSPDMPGDPEIPSNETTSVPEELMAEAKDTPAGTDTADIVEPSKKGKKKKKKKGSAVLDELTEESASQQEVSETVTPAEPADLEQPTDLPVSEVQNDVVVEVPGEASVPASEEVQADDEWGTPANGKKSKKKKKKGSIALQESLAEAMAEPIAAADTVPDEPLEFGKPADQPLVDDDAQKEAPASDPKEAQVDDESSVPTSGKKSKKKKKKGSMALEESSSASAPEASGPDTATPTEPVESEQPADVTGPGESTQPDVAEVSPVSESQEAQAEDEWGMPTSGKKSKKKKSKQDKVDSQPAPEASGAESTEQATLTGDALTEEPTPMEPEKTEEPSTSAAAEPPTPGEAATADGEPQATSKKSKKKKKKTQSLLIENPEEITSTTPSEPSTETPGEPFLGDPTEAMADIPIEASAEQSPEASVGPVTQSSPETSQQETPTIAPEPEAEPEVPKKSKKNKKKKKNALSLDDTPVEQIEGDSALVNTDEVGAESSVLPITEKEILPAGDENPKEGAAASHVDQTSPPLAADEQLPKDDKQEATSEAVVTAGESVIASDSKLGDLASDNTQQSVTQEASTENPGDSLSPVKLSKKDKKKKKKQAALEELPKSEPKATTTADTDTGLAAEQVEKTNIPDESTIAPGTESVLPGSGDAENTATIDASVGETASSAEQALAQDLQAKPEDDWGGLSLKKDKKKKKAKDMESETLQEPEATHLPEPEPDTQLDDGATRQAVSFNEGEIKTDLGDVSLEPGASRDGYVSATAEPEPDTMGDTWNLGLSKGGEKKEDKSVDKDFSVEPTSVEKASETPELQDDAEQKKDEDEWTTGPAKKDRKKKKKKGQNVHVDLEELPGSSKEATPAESESLKDVQLPNTEMDSSLYSSVSDATPSQALPDHPPSMPPPSPEEASGHALPDIESSPPPAMVDGPDVKPDSVHPSPAVEPAKLQEPGPASLLDESQLPDQKEPLIPPAEPAQEFAQEPELIPATEPISEQPEEDLGTVETSKKSKKKKKKGKSSPEEEDVASTSSPDDTLARTLQNPDAGHENVAVAIPEEVQHQPDDHPQPESLIDPLPKVEPEIAIEPQVTQDDGIDDWAGLSKKAKKKKKKAKDLPAESIDEAEPAQEPQTIQNDSVLVQAKEKEPKLEPSTVVETETLPSKEDLPTEEPQEAEQGQQPAVEDTEPVAFNLSKKDKKKKKKKAKDSPVEPLEDADPIPEATTQGSSEPAQEVQLVSDPTAETQPESTREVQTELEPVQDVQPEPEPTHDPESVTEPEPIQEMQVEQEPESVQEVLLEPEATHELLPKSDPALSPLAQLELLNEPLPEVELLQPKPEIALPVDEDTAATTVLSKKDKKKKKKKGKDIPAEPPQEFETIHGPSELASDSSPLPIGDTEVAQETQPTQEPSEIVNDVEPLGTAQQDVSSEPTVAEAQPQTEENVPQPVVADEDLADGSPSKKDKKKKKKAKGAFLDDDISAAQDPPDLSSSAEPPVNAETEQPIKPSLAANATMVDQEVSQPAAAEEDLVTVGKSKKDKKKKKKTQPSEDTELVEQISQGQDDVFDAAQHMSEPKTTMTEQETMPESAAPDLVERSDPAQPAFPVTTLPVPDPTIADPASTGHATSQAVEIETGTPEFASAEPTTNDDDFWAGSTEKDKKKKKKNKTLEADVVEATFLPEEEHVPALPESTHALDEPAIAAADDEDLWATTSSKTGKKKGKKDKTGSTSLDVTGILPESNKDFTGDKDMTDTVDTSVPTIIASVPELQPGDTQQEPLPAELLPVQTSLEQEPVGPPEQETVHIEDGGDASTEVSTIVGASSTAAEDMEMPSTFVRDAPEDDPFVSKDERKTEQDKAEPQTTAQPEEVEQSQTETLPTDNQTAAVVEEPRTQDDEWALPTKDKKGKKNKKNRQSQMQAMAQDDVQDKPLETAAEPTLSTVEPSSENVEGEAKTGHDAELHAPADDVAVAPAPAVEVFEEGVQAALQTTEPAFVPSTELTDTVVQDLPEVEVTSLGDTANTAQLPDRLDNTLRYAATGNDVETEITPQAKTDLVEPSSEPSPARKLSKKDKKKLKKQGALPEHSGEALLPSLKEGDQSIEADADANAANSLVTDDKKSEEPSHDQELVEQSVEPIKESQIAAPEQIQEMEVTEEPDKTVAELEIDTFDVKDASASGPEILETQLQKDESPDDFGGSTKKSKKSKKGKKTGTLHATAGDTQQVPDAPASETAEPHPEEVAKDEQIEPLVSEGVPELPTLHENTAVADDEWAIPAKKGKKGKKSKPVSGIATPMAETDTPLTVELVEARPAAEQEVADRSIFAVGLEAGTEKPQLIEPVDPAQFGPATNDDDLSALLNTGEATTSGSNVDTEKQPFELEPKQPFVEIQDPVLEPSITEQESTSQDPTIKEQEQPAEEARRLEELPELPVVTSQDQIAATETLEHARPEAEFDEWSLPGKKKGKKGKKAKDIAIPLVEPTEPSASMEVPPAIIEEEPHSSRSQIIPQTDLRQAVDDLLENPEVLAENLVNVDHKGEPLDITEHATSRPAEEPVSLQTEALAESEGQEKAEIGSSVLVGSATLTEAVDPEESWGSSVKKKSKKDKKRKSNQSAPIETPDNLSSAKELPSTSIMDDQSHDAQLTPGLTQDHPLVDENDEIVTTESKKNKKKNALETVVQTSTSETFDDRSSQAIEDYTERSGFDSIKPAWDSTPKEPTPLPEMQSIFMAEPQETGDATRSAENQGSVIIDPLLQTETKGLDIENPDFHVPAGDGLLVNMPLPEDMELPREKEPLPRSSREEEASPITDKKMQPTTSPDKDKKSKKRQSQDGAQAAGVLTAGAIAAVSGVAALAEQYTGGKKAKKGKKKILDKRQPQEEDIFDDPALWEGADKKPLQSTDSTQAGEHFWDVGGEEHEKSREAMPTPRSESHTESEEGWKETARQGAKLDDDDIVESPVLGRRSEARPDHPGPLGLLRRGSSIEDPVTGLFEVDKTAGDRGFDVTELRRSPSRGLPAVQEIPEAEMESSRNSWVTPKVNRDSGFVTDSPNPLRRRSHLFDDGQRDSGVHSGDWTEGARTPETSTDKRSHRSPFGTPVVLGPTVAGREATPEPEKKLRRKKTMDYGGLTEGRASPAPVLAPISTRSTRSPPSESIAGPATALVATTALAATAMTMAGQRSISDSGPHLHQQQPQPGPNRSVARRSVSNTSLARRGTPEPLKLRPESPGIKPSPTPPLRRVDKRMSGDLRSLRQQNSSSSTTPVANEGRVRTKDMTDVYDGFGEGRIGSPRSPTRPHSMRRRQSMQVIELESKVEQLIAENRLLTDARSHAEQNLSQRAASVLTERDAEIEALKQSLHFLRNEVARLTEVNEGLTSANAELASKDNREFADLEVRHADVTRELDKARGAHNEIDQTLRDKDAEIADLRAQLDEAKEQVREMQRQILASKAGDADFLNIQDEDYFDHRCQQLCSHAQQWVLRFSKFSDMRACRLTSEINDEKTIDRLDNSVLDGSDVDVYLKDRVKRRDIFMSMTMNMIWEFVFTRYLFGMDREQRQKLKSLEKLLTEVGPPQAVRQWRAVTLTLLSKRDSFKQQRDQDTEAVVQAVFQTLCKILPPPGNLEGQIQSQLRRVMREAVDLSIEMRTQKAEYIMLPPLQPEYDADGELAGTVQFNSSMMNERGGSSGMSNEELEAAGAVVRVVLFPLVVKKGDDTGVGDEEIVVCPAQVLIVREKSRRHGAPSSDAGGASLGARSHISVVTEHMSGLHDGSDI